jgi:hypothetical protein
MEWPSKLACETIRRGPDEEAQDGYGPVIDEPLANLWGARKKEDSAGQSLTLIRWDSVTRHGHKIDSTVNPYEVPDWVKEEDLAEALHELTRPPFSVDCSLPSLQSLGDPADLAARHTTYDGARLKKAEERAVATFAPREAGSREAFDNFKRFEEPSISRPGSPWGAKVRRYTRRMPGLLELHTLYFHSRYSHAAQGAADSLQRKFQKDPGGKIEMSFQPVEVMGAKECWRRTKALVEMLHTCDIGKYRENEKGEKIWENGWEKGMGDEWLMKHTPAYFIRNAIVLRIVVNSIKDAMEVCKAADSWSYGSAQAEVIMQQNDFHSHYFSAGRLRPLPLDACLRLWILVGVLTRTVLVEVQVHLAPLWDARQDAALAVELLEGRMDHPWVTEWQAAAEEVADAVVELHEDEPNPVLRYEEKNEQESRDEAKAEADLAAAREAGPEALAAYEAALQEERAQRREERRRSSLLQQQITSDLLA